MLLTLMTLASAAMAGDRDMKELLVGTWTSDCNGATSVFQSDRLKCVQILFTSKNGCLAILVKLVGIVSIHEGGGPSSSPSLGSGPCSPSGPGAGGGGC